MTRERPQTLNGRLDESLGLIELTCPVLCRMRTHYLDQPIEVIVCVFSLYHDLFLLLCLRHHCTTFAPSYSVILNLRFEVECQVGIGNDLYRIVPSEPSTIVEYRCGGSERKELSDK